MAWGLNVDVRSIERNDEGITVTYTHPVQIIGEQKAHAEDKTDFDYLIVACPLLKEDLEKIMDLTEEEASLPSASR